MRTKAEHSSRAPAAANPVVGLASPQDAEDSQTGRSCGEVSPFDAIYDTYAPLLRKIAVARFGISSNDAADLVHDVFATYLANSTRVSELRSYLIGAICNASRSYLRKRAVRSEVCSGLDACLAADDDEVMERVVRNLLIGRILGRLGRSCRDALYRFYIHGETAAMIAEHRDTSAGYIGRLLHFCRKRARDAYQSMENGKP